VFGSTVLSTAGIHLLWLSNLFFEKFFSLSIWREWHLVFGERHNLQLASATAHAHQVRYGVRQRALVCTTAINLNHSVYLSLRTGLHFRQCARSTGLLRPRSG
jgi:hypothetical protein